MNPRSLTRLFALSLLIAAPVASIAPRVARADLPKPPGWEPTCTIEKAQKVGEVCEQCRGYQDPDPCQEALAKKGYKRHCTEGGAGSYVAVWCKLPPAGDNTAEVKPKPIETAAPASSASPSSASPPSVPPASDNRRGTGCGVDPSASGPWEGLAVMVAIGLGIALTSRRSRRGS